MEYFVEQALTYTECNNKIRMKYGDRVTILYHKDVRIRGGPFGLFGKDGVEITGFTTSNVIKPGTFQSSSLPVQTEKKQPLDFHEERKKILDSTNNSSVATANKVVEKSENTALQAVLREMQEIKKGLEASSASKQNEKHTTISRIEEILELNDFSPGYSQNILDKIKKEFSLDSLNDYNKVQDTILEWIGESISLYKDETIKKLPRIIVIVGPTGVGKTTTIAKLAAVFIISNRSLKVRMITIDSFRIGAKEQIEKYGDLMQIPVSYVEDTDDLKKTIAQHSEETDLILIDTIGKSPRDSVKLGEMKQLLDACGRQAELHLAVAATTKSSDLKEIIRQFEPFNYRSVIVTKLDETIRVGNVISALSDLRKSVSYITDGQKVPSNIQKAAIIRFLLNLEGFQVNRTKLEERFPTDESEQIQWR